MKTTFDFEIRLYQLIDNSMLGAEITGRLIKGQRPNMPAGYPLEDVSLTCLPVPNDQVQETVGSINIHVPNLKIQIAGQPDQSQPNHPRLNYLTKLAMEAIKMHVGEDWHCDFEQQLTFEEPEILSTYSSIRVSLYSINI